MQFVSVQLVERLHARMIERYGGSHGLRDRGLLESPVSRAENKLNYEDGVSVAAVGAALAFGLIKNHAFIDGNKRVGFAALVVFLEGNGYRLTCSEEQETVEVQRCAAGELTEDAWTAWVESVVTEK